MVTYNPTAVYLFCWTPVMSCLHYKLGSKADIKREVMIWFVCWCEAQKVFLVVFSVDSFQFSSFDSPLKDLEVKQFLFLHFFFLVHFCHSGTSSVDLFLSLMCVCLGSLCYFWSNCWNLLLGRANPHPELLFLQRRSTISPGVEILYGL